MRTRTRLTTPPGQDPADTADDRPEVERYVPAIALPTEPRVPGRFRQVWVALAIVAVLALLAYGVFRVATAGQDFDPALDGSITPDVDTDDPADDVIPGEDDLPGDEDDLPGDE